MRLTFRLTENTDPEERLEEAALWKALHDEYGPDIAAVTGDAPATFGRPRRSEHREPFPYWDDPAFLGACGREFSVCPIDGVNEAVAALHAKGMGAFIKSTRDKHWIARVPVGESWREAFGDMVYSFIDGGPSLMVQELCRVEYEHRFFVIRRRIVTHSPNAVHLTPLDYPETFDFEKPTDHKPSLFCAHGFLAGVVEQVAAKMRAEHAVIDCALINGKPACVELNPMVLGGVGLFACDVRALAGASRALLPAEKSAAA